MPLLEEAKMSELVDFFGESRKVAEAAESVYEDDGVQEEEVEVESSEASEDVNEEDASPSETEEDVKEEPGEEQDVAEVEAQDSEPEDDKPPQKDSKWVPRDRLNEVNEKWRQREQQLLLQVGALEERAKQASAQPPPRQQSDDDWLEDIMGENTPAAPNADIEQLKAVQRKMLQWQEEYTRQQVYNEFNAELQAAMEKYPDIPEAVFRDAVVRDGSVNMIELGEALSAERASLVEKWKADWTKSNPAPPEAPEPEVARRPSRRSSSQPAVTSDKPKSFSSVREAGDAMAKEMADFFENLQQ